MHKELIIKGLKKQVDAWSARPMFLVAAKGKHKHVEQNADMRSLHVSKVTSVLVSAWDVYHRVIYFSYPGP
jgi:hypothetical protein